MKKKIFTGLFLILLGLNIVFASLWYLSYKENQQIKGDMLLQYSHNIYLKLHSLEGALEHRDDKKQLTNYLQHADKFHRHNVYLTGNATYLGQHLQIPRELYLLSVSNIIHHALSKASKDEFNEDVITSVEEFTLALSIVADKLDYKNFSNLNLKERYQRLNLAAEEIEYYLYGAAQ